MTTEHQAETRCWLCRGPATRDTPYASVGYARCEDCGFLFQPERSSAESEAEHYDSAYFASYGHQTDSLADYDDDQDQRRYEANVRLDFVHQFLGGGSLLEVGAASGFFVEAACQHGFQAQGVEPGAVPAQRARAKGLAVATGTLADAAAGTERFDAVVAWHVLEHLPQPREAVAQMVSLLKPGGWIFLELPNVGSIAAARAGVSWACLDPDAHVAHYAPAHLNHLVEGAGLQVARQESISFRGFSADRARRVAHAIYDAVVLRTPALTHPNRHELLRVAAQLPKPRP